MRRTDAPRILGDRYELQRQLGSGGAGTVWRAYDRTLGRGVAIKLLHAGLADDPAVEARFRTEATTAAQLTHANAVQVYDVGKDGDDDYLVMELVEGPSLADLLQQGALPPDTAAAVTARVAAALGAAHDAGIVHRDVKPANLLLSTDGRVKLADFGIARVLGEATARLTRAGTMLGTARYLAPEQLGDDPVDARADVYALGLVLYEALTGRQPFGEGSPVEVATRRLTSELPPVRVAAPNVPVDLEHLVNRATRRDPGARFDDGHALASALAPFVASDAEQVLAQRIRDLRMTRGRTYAPPADAPQNAAPGTAPPRSGAPRTPPPQTAGPQAGTAPHGTHPTGMPNTSAARPPAAAGPPAAAPPPTQVPGSAPSPGPGGPGPVSPLTGAPPPHAEGPDHTLTLPATAPSATSPDAGSSHGASGGGTSSAIRWVLVVLIAIAIGVAAILVFGDGERPWGDATPSPPSSETALEIVDVADHDPDGDLREWPDRVGNAIDGDPDTFWPTESYHDADIVGPQKEGVGLWIALEESATLTNVEVDLTRDGGVLELWLGDGAPAEDHLPSDWGERIHQGQIGAADLRIDDLPDDVEGDTLLLWFTELPPGGNGYRAEVRNIRVHGG